ncbi:hypothetical protein [uncultured Bacteroides sp.]|nr:hypothetical protein [uncultured Bacteroides sp.]
METDRPAAQTTQTEQAVRKAEKVVEMWTKTHSDKTAPRASGIKEL